MRKSYKFQRKVKTTKKYFYNYQITSPSVLVIDERGVTIGEFNTKEAIQSAQERGFDLVEVSPSAKPPVCKIMDYGSFKYQKEKELKKQKKQSKALGVKSIRISMKIGDHDKATRIKQAEKFLEKGHKIKIELILRGREFTHMDIAKKIIMDFRQEISIPTQIEQATTKQGNKLFLILLPEKQ